MAGKKQNIEIKFTNRTLTPDEADSIRELAASLKPKVYLVLPLWPWLTVRSIEAAKAEKLIEALRALPNLKFREVCKR